MSIFFDNHSKLEGKKIKFHAHGDGWVMWCEVTMESIRNFYELKGSDTEIITVLVEKWSQFEKLAKSIIEAREYDNGVWLGVAKANYILKCDGGARYSFELWQSPFARSARYKIDSDVRDGYWPTEFVIQTLLYFLPASEQ